MLKGFLLASDWSDPSPLVIFSLIASKILILGSVIFLLAGDILARSRAFINSPKRGLISVVILFAIFVILFGAPFLRSVVINPQGFATGIGFGPGPNPAGGLTPFKIGFEDASVNFNSESNLWTYQITARNQLNEDAEIVEIALLKPLSGGFLNIISEKEQLAPPFGENIDVSGGKKTNEKIIIPPGSTTILKIFSKNPAVVVFLTEKKVRYDISFWTLADEYPHGGPAETQMGVELEIVEALDPNVKVFLSGAVPPTPENFKTNFAAGEFIYPFQQGLLKRTRYGFRVINTAGEIVVPLDLGKVRVGEGAEGHGRFNSKERPLPHGLYRIELITVKAGKGFVVAYENFSIY